MQGDGNLVEYGPGGQVMWNAGTNGNPGAYAIMQGDGNLVVYSSAGQGAVVVRHEWSCRRLPCPQRWGNARDRSIRVP